MSPRILIVDDDPVQRRLLEAAVKRMGFDYESADGGKPALAALAGAGDKPYALVILDLVMPDLGGLEVMKELQAQRIEVPVIVQTANGGVDTAVNAMRAGAVDFVVKPVSPDRLETVIRTSLKVESHQGETKRAREFSQGSIRFDQVVTSSANMRGVLKLAEKGAASNIPILIDGESGVGKELLARAIQGTSPRANKPFVTVNCGALPGNLVESILFGHEKGAFTGAVDKHVGKFREAEGGTLFLDEVGELPLDIQVKLLRALQEGEIDPVGSRKPIPVDFRLISATNRNLMDQVREGKFREDLYYRLNVFPLNIPSLSERMADVPDLARLFLSRFAAKEGKRGLNAITPEAMQLLTCYDWPGNIRQLENAIFRAVVLADGPALTPDDFPQIQTQVDFGHGLGMPAMASGPTPTTAPSLPSLGTSAAVFDPSEVPSVHSMEAQPPAEATSHVHTSTAPVHTSGAVYAQVVPYLPDSGLIGEAVPPRTSSSLTPIGENGTVPFGYLRAFGEDGHVMALEDLEREAIANAIDHYGGRMSEVARRLKIGRSTLYRKLKEYGLEEPDAGQIAAE